jgi:outer membrane protein assembly factor BamB
MLSGVYQGDEDTVIANPGSGPAYAETESDTQALALEMLSETANEVSDTDAWFERNGLERPAEDLTNDMWMVYLDKGARTAEVMKDGIYDCLLDLGDLCRVEEDPGDIKIRFAALDGDVLYISVSRKGSSDLYYKTGFIAAIDLNEKALLWKSDPAVAGAYNFTVLDGRIFAGYGGTGEDDYLYQIDALTGRTLGSVRLATGPDYILAKDGVLYVRCYDTDYTFSLAA